MKPLFSDDHIVLYNGDARHLADIPDESVDLKNLPRNDKGQFLKGISYNPKGTFKKGQIFIWRSPQPYWDRDWLYNEYVIKARAAHEIATDCGCTENNILYFLHKLDIPRRTLVEVHAIKYWGDKVAGLNNPMFGKKGKDSPAWRGGICPERQAFYGSIDWRAAVREVWKRDCATCQRCGKQPHKRGGKDFHIHHIISFGNLELRIEIKNLVLLCKECHYFVHSTDNVESLFIREEVMI